MGLQDYWNQEKERVGKIGSGTQSWILEGECKEGLQFLVILSLEYD